MNTLYSLLGKTIELSIEVNGVAQLIYQEQGRYWLEGLWGKPYSIVPHSDLC